MKGSEIRNLFLKYFESTGHKIEPSSSLVPHDDPTILFSNAGMNQFKGCFLGTEKRAYTRATTSQKCMRISGKHNDFENVGVTARHHTFFEMLGNFSFGDYFKEDAIKYAWEFITEVLKLSSSRLWVTIFENDDEAGDLWHKVAGVSKDRIIKLGEKDNFWAMGDTGPCGPCTEIHYYLGADESQQSKEGFLKEDGSYLEIWNLVFMQFNRQPDGTLQPLPKPSVDTGMGLERVASIKQGVAGNYETDLARGVIEVCEQLTGHKYVDGSYMGEDIVKDPTQAKNVAMRVIADHSRAATFLIADGVTPASDGRGYVLRRILRRAIRHGKVLGFKKPFLIDTTAKVVSIFGSDYPELVTAKDIIAKVVDAEERKFQETLDSGLSILHKEVEKLPKNSLFSGETAFLLYDTYGFPVDLTADALKPYGIQVDEEGYNSAMTRQKTRSREERKSKDINFTSVNITASETKFIGYSDLSADSKLLQVIQTEDPNRVHLVFDTTPFYAESGGQVGDKGEVKIKDITLRVTDTQKLQDKFFVHECEVVSGKFTDKLVGEKAILNVDKNAREAIIKNHTATHLVQSGLRKILGDHVKQAGSRVDETSSRFDYSHFEPVTFEQLKEVESWVNEYLRANHHVNISSMSLDVAKKQGATALFGEKYKDIVRVVQVGPDSLELCGGCHVGASGEIGYIYIANESGISSGVRRIECYTGEGVSAEIFRKKQLVSELTNLFKCEESKVSEKLLKSLERIKQLEREIEESKAKVANFMITGLVNNAKTSSSGMKVISSVVDTVDMQVAREIVDNARVRLGSGVVVVGVKDGDNASILTGVTADLTKKVNAGDMIKKIVAHSGGRGGGKPDFAQLGGMKASDLQKAIEFASDFLANV